MIWVIQVCHKCFCFSIHFVSFLLKFSSIFQSSMIVKCIQVLIYLIKEIFALLTVICCPIYHWLEISCEMDTSRARRASAICSLTTDRQPLIHKARNHLLARLYFDSNKQEMTNRQLNPSDVSSFLPIQEKISHQEANCNRGIYCIL